MKRFFSAFVYIAIFICIGGCGKNPATKTSIIPIPLKMEQKKGVYLLSADADVSVNSSSLDGIAALLSDKLNPTEANGAGSSPVRLILHDEPEHEAYTLTVDRNGIKIEAGSEAGVFYGVQSLLQLMEQNQTDAGYAIPHLNIADKPRFSYRGMHLDVSRHFFGVDFVKKYIDLLAMYKMNRLHWHLTDGVGWRIEIKKYPLLTQKTAFRPERTWKEFWEKGDEKRFAEEGDENVYGGYYTQEEIKEVVAYAQSKYVTIIPEIEMPGHSEEVFVAYPELSCSGKPYVNSDFCAGNDKVFDFLDDVLTEVIALFPSEYIHVGGDEAAKTAWKTCPLCRQRMHDHHLQDVDELQSYFMKRVEAMVEAKGRKIIGWDEILEGGLPPSATVMSWRGEEGGIKAAQEGHDVIMVPGAYCYFDSYQADPQTEPEAIGGYLPLSKVYSYRPLPPELTEEEQKHIIGVQGAIWTEYIPTEEHLEYMLLPRMIALSEIAWSEEANLDWDHFKYRLFDNLPILERKGYNFHRPNFEIAMTMQVDPKEKVIAVEFDTEQFEPEIRYTTDGSLPTATSTLYEGKFNLTGANDLKASIFKDGAPMRPVLQKPVNYHKAIGAKVDYRTKNCPRYPAGGDTALVDGYRGGLGYGDGKWQGFLKDIDVVIDLGETQPIHSVSANFMQLIAPGVFMPTYMTVEISKDGKEFVEICKDENDIPMDKSELVFREFKGDVGGKEARYIRFFAKNPKGYIFTDEIEVF